MLCFITDLPANGSALQRHNKRIIEYLITIIHNKKWINKVQFIRDYYLLKQTLHAVKVIYFDD